MIGFLLGAGALGIIIAVMEEGEFPGWGKMSLCVLAALVPAIVINAVLPPELFFVGLVVGAACAALAISATCAMTLQRAAIAAGIYLALQMALSTAFYFMTR